MKKGLLLGAILVLGATAYGQANKTIVPFDTDGNATAVMPIEVTGEIHDPLKKSLVIEIISSASPTGTGFAFEQQDLFATAANATPQVSTTAGIYKAKILMNNVIEAFSSPTTVVYGISVDGGNVTKDAKVPGNPTGNAIVNTGTANPAGDVPTKVEYLTSGDFNSANTVFDGRVEVTTTAGNIVGTYADTSAKLIFEVVGQDMTNVPVVPAI